jgi:hypothetical protein
MNKISSNSKYSTIDIKVKLFKEDLEYLTNTIIHNFDYVVIYADEYELENFAELNDIKKDKISFYKINAYDKGNNFNELKMTVSIHKDRIHIDISDYNELKCKAIENIINDLIDNRKLIFNIIGSGYIYFTSILILGLLAILVKEPLFIKTINIYYITILGITLIILAIISYYIRFNLKNIIILQKQRYGFYRRNKDKIIVGIIVAFIASLITVLISYLISLKIK